MDLSADSRALTLESYPYVLEVRERIRIRYSGLKFHY
jgi:hypothetical protein